MKVKLLYKIILVLIMIACADRIVGIFMNYEVRHLKNGNLYELNYKLFNAHPSIVILGSSRANHHYNTAILQQKLPGKILNYGQDGTNVFYYYIVLKTLVQARQKPKLVIVDIKPGEFDINPNANMLSGFYPIIDKMPVTNDDLSQVSTYEKIKLLSYSYRFNNQVFENISATHGAKKDTAEITGFLPIPVKKAILQRDNFKNAHVNSSIEKYFNAIINLCKRNSIHLVVCTSPYYHNLVYDASLTETEKICKQNNIQYINYVNNSLLGFADSLFADETHLNANGADVFTRDIVTRIKTNN